MNHENKIKDGKPKQFLTSGEAAKRLNLTPEGVRAMERRGALNGAEG